MNHTVYLKLSQITELTHKDVVLKDVAQVYCDDQNVMNKCNSMKVMTVKVDAKRRYIMSALDIINKLKQLDSTIDVNNVGETDFIIAYKPPSPPAYIWQWTKTVFVCLVCFFGAAFAIMTFNNDVDIPALFEQIYTQVTGQPTTGNTVLEISYSLGIGLGVLFFFNHFGSIGLAYDPTPMQVQMRLYEDDINTTIIEDISRNKE